MPDIEPNLWQNLKAGDVISLWDFMADLWIKGEVLFNHMENVSTVALLQDIGQGNAQSRPKIKTTSGQLKSVITIANYFKLSVSHRLAENLSLQIEAHTYEPSPQELNMIALAIKKEMSGLSFLSIGGDKHDYWMNGLAHYERELLDKFPDAITDLDEGHKCFSVGRYTACVFHLMRGMEVVVRVMGDKVGAEVADPNSDEIYPWGKIVGNMRTPIESMPRGKKKDDWWAAQLMLHSCNRAFRTKTAHPKRTYTEDEAEDVIQSVKKYIEELSGLLT